MKGFATAAVFLLAGCLPHTGTAARAAQMRRAVWTEISAGAPTRGLDPLFVFALVKIESGFDPGARRGENRGLLQIKPRLWKQASKVPYGEGVWDWRTNLDVGMDVLGKMKAELQRKGVFTYPLLLASFRFGGDYVASRGYDLGRMPEPADPLARRIWSGDIHPLEPPND